MIDYHLVKLEQEVERLQSLIDAFSKEFNEAIWLRKEGDDLFQTVQNIEDLLRTYTTQVESRKIGLIVAEIQTMLIKFPSIKRVAWIHRQDTLKLLGRRRKKIYELHALASNKYEKQRQYVDWVEENFGSLLDSHFEPACMLITKYDEETRELDVYFGGQEDPVGLGHGHYVFKLAEQPFLTFSRQPA